MGLLDKPVALFGHSMGALVMYELARKLAQDVGVSPILLIISGCRPPTVRHNTVVLDQGSWRDGKG